MLCGVEAGEAGEGGCLDDAFEDGAGPWLAEGDDLVAEAELAVAGGVAGEGGEVASFHGFGPADVGAFKRTAEDGVDAGGPAEGRQEDGGKSGHEAATRERDGHYWIVWGGSEESARRKFELGSAGGEVVPCTESGGLGFAFEGAEMLVLLAFRGTVRVICAGRVDSGEAGGDEGFGEVGGLALGGGEADVGVEAVAVEDAFPAGEDGEWSAAEVVRGEGAGYLTGADDGVVADAAKVACLVCDAIGAGRALNGFRAVGEIKSENAFISGSRDLEAVTVVGAAGEKAAVFEAVPAGAGGWW